MVPPSTDCWKHNSDQARSKSSQGMSNVMSGCNIACFCSSPNVLMTTANNGPVLKRGLSPLMLLIHSSFKRPPWLLWRCSGFAACGATEGLWISHAYFHNKKRRHCKAETCSAHSNDANDALEFRLGMKTCLEEMTLALEHSKFATSHSSSIHRDDIKEQQCSDPASWFNHD